MDKNVDDATILMLKKYISKRFLYRIEAFDEQFMTIKKMKEPVFEELFPEGMSKSPSHENPAASGSGQVIEISNFSAFQASKTEYNA